VGSLYGWWMRRSLALLALLAIPLTACGSGIPPAAQTTTVSAAMTSGDAATTEAMTEAMTSGPGSAGAMVQPSGSMMDHPESAMTTADSMHPASEAMTAESPPAGTATGVTVTTAGSDVGQVLFDGTGQAIYLFAKETTAVPDCYGDCAVAWPPVLAEGSPVAGAGTMTDLLGTTPRTDGSTQVTYAGHPLYYYAHEGKNVVTCHNVNEFGGLWLAVTPTGEAAA
jgi:predicted lipoprotein with Yx(FWY)xxD motif